jgi:hypothetical protein
MGLILGWGAWWCVGSQAPVHDLDGLLADMAALCCYLPEDGRPAAGCM